MSVEVTIIPADREQAQRIIQGLTRLALKNRKATTRNQAREHKEKTVSPH